MKWLREHLPSPFTTAWLVATWILLWGDLSWGNLVNGIIIALAIGLLFPMPQVGGIRTIRPIALVWLVVRFLADVVSSGFRVAWAALRPGTARSAVIRVQLRSHSDFILATTAGMTTLIPGSVAINAHRRTGVLYLHVFDVPSHKPMRYVNEFRETVLRQEERLLRAFASKEELEDAGYLPGWRAGSGEISEAHR